MGISKIGNGGATVGGYGILASLDRESASQHGGGTHAGAGTRGAIGVGVALAALLAWWCASGPSPVIAPDAKPLWQVHAVAPGVATPGVATPGVATPGVMPGVVVPAVVVPALPEAPAVIVNDALSPVATRASTASMALAPARPAMGASAALPARRGHHAARAPLNTRRETPRPAALKIVALAGAPLLPDHDLSLLTALVAYKNGAASPAHDIVEPRMADSTEALLQRCGRVGGEEGRLCRTRICAGRAADGACRPD